MSLDNIKQRLNNHRNMRDKIQGEIARAERMLDNLRTQEHMYLGAISELQHLIVAEGESAEEESLDELPADTPTNSHALPN